MKIIKRIEINNRYCYYYNLTNASQPVKNAVKNGCKIDFFKSEGILFKYINIINENKKIRITLSDNEKSLERCKLSTIYLFIHNNELIGLCAINEVLGVSINLLGIRIDYMYLTDENGHDRWIKIMLFCNNNNIEFNKLKLNSMLSKLY